MIRGLHAMFYTSEPDALRAFFRDKLGLPASDVGDGWLIFDLAEADLGCHPADPKEGAPSGTPNISFYCDDIKQTVTELTARGVEFTGPVADHGYGLVTFFKVPGGFEIQLYQPKYIKKDGLPSPSDEFSGPTGKSVLREKCETKGKGLFACQTKRSGPRGG